MDHTVEVGDENVPPSTHSWTENSICVSPPGAVRSVLTDVNVSVNEIRNNSESAVSSIHHFLHVEKSLS